MPSVLIRSVPRGYRPALVLVACFGSGPIDLSAIQRMVVVFTERCFRWNVAFPEEHIMTTPEQALIRHRLRTLDDQAKAAAATEALKQEDHWVAEFIANLAGIIRKLR
jgi:hypothetical protein